MCLLYWKPFAGPVFFLSTLSFYSKRNPSIYGFRCSCENQPRKMDFLNFCSYNSLNSYFSVFWYFDTPVGQSGSQCFQILETAIASTELASLFSITLTKPIPWKSLWVNQVRLGVVNRMSRKKTWIKSQLADHFWAVISVVWEWVTVYYEASANMAECTCPQPPLVAPQKYRRTKNPCRTTKI